MLFATDVPGGRNKIITTALEYFSYEHRKKPMLLALGVHLLVLIMLLIPSSLFDFNRNIEEIYTVELFETVEPVPPQKEFTPPAPKAKIPPPKPVIKEKSEPVTSLQPIETAHGEIISLKPRLQKKDLRKKITKSEQHKVASALDRLKSELARKKAEQNAAAAVDDAVEKLREALHSKVLPAPSTSSTSKIVSASTGTGKKSSEIDSALKLYYVAVSQQIHEHWILPKLQDWGKNLKARVVVHVRRDGIVTKQYFEQKSDNIFFNQFVEKTVKESLPFPPFPHDIKENSLEIGLNFYPGGLQ